MSKSYQFSGYFNFYFVKFIVRKTKKDVTLSTFVFLFHSGHWFGKYSLKNVGV